MDTRRWMAALAAALLLGLAGCGAETLPEETARETAPSAETATEETDPEVPVMEAAVPETAPTMPEAGPFVMVTTEDLSKVYYEDGGKQPVWGQTAVARRDVRRIFFHGTLEGAPEQAWDVSQARDGSVRAWMEGSDLHVAAGGRIAPNPNAAWMFAYFTALEEIDFGGCFDTSGVTDMGEMFYYCFCLTGVDVRGFDTAWVTNMSYMFYNCVSLEALDVSGFDTSSVTGMGHMFNGCRSLTQLDLGGFDTAAVADMRGMFRDCRNLRTLNVGSFDTSGVVRMDFLFDGCCSLEALDLGTFRTSRVTDMSGMFRECYSLEALDLSAFDTSNVGNMAEMFLSCESLTALQCPDARIRAEYRNR